MTTTMLAALALAGALAPGVKPEFQAKTDYGQAMKQAANEKKPIAVLIGKGDVFAKMMADSGLSAEAKKVLTEKYVCLAVNVETEAGKTLAGQFQMSEGGLIISSAGGTHQALRQPGTVSASDLAKHTSTYATATETPTTTVTVGGPTNTPTYVYPAGGAYPPGTVYPAGGFTPSGGYRLPSSPYGLNPAQCTGGARPPPRPEFRAAGLRWSVGSSHWPRWFRLETGLTRSCRAGVAQTW
jgi:hypothetical protein